MRILADKEAPFDLNTFFLQYTDFFLQSLRIYYYTIAQNTYYPGVQYPGWDLVKNGLLAFDNHRMTGICATLVAHHHVGRGGQHIDYFAFSLVTPLRTEYNPGWHNSLSLSFAHKNAPCNSCPERGYLGLKEV